MVYHEDKLWSMTRPQNRSFSLSPWHLMTLRVLTSLILAYLGSPLYGNFCATVFGLQQPHGKKSGILLHFQKGVEGRNTKHQVFSFKQPWKAFKMKCIIILTEVWLHFQIITTSGNYLNECLKQHGCMCYTLHVYKAIIVLSQVLLIITWSFLYVIHFHVLKLCILLHFSEDA